MIRLILVVFALLFCLSESGQVKGAMQSAQRSIENKVPANVPLKIKIKNEEKIRTNTQWYKDFEMEITNTSEKPIYYFSLFVLMPGVTNMNGATMIFNVDFGRAELVDITVRPWSDDKPLLRGETFTFVISPENQNAWAAWLKRNNEPEVSKIEIVFNHLSFGDGTGLTSTGAVPIPAKPNHK